MLRRLLPLAAILALAVATPAHAAHSFVLTPSGAKPDVAVDRGGTGHFVWDERAGEAARSRTTAASCAAAAAARPGPSAPSARSR